MSKLIPNRTKTTAQSVIISGICTWSYRKSIILLGTYIIYYPMYLKMTVMQIAPANKQRLLTGTETIKLWYILANPSNLVTIGITLKMAYTFGLKIPNWDINKSEYEEVDSLPMMSSPVPAALIFIGYLSFVLKIGPSIMKGRKPFKLNKLLIVYNALQVIFSFYMMQRYFRYLLKTDFIQSKCLINEPHHREEILSHMWIYLMAKVTELLDTVFFVLRKKYKQVTFLHIYHHSMMMIGSWMYIKYAPTENVVFIGFLNSLIHVFMYAYYGLAALGPGVAKYLTWKKYLTTLQMVQFVSIFVQYLTSLKYTECPPPRGVAVFIFMNIFLFIYLFGDFYRQSYKQKGNKAKLNIDEKSKAKTH